MASVYRNPEAERDEQAWLRWGDVRMPRTESEAHAAIDLVGTKITNLEAYVTERPEQAEGLAYALRKWREKLAELEWALERLRAGDTAPSLDLARERAKFSETEAKLRAQVETLESERKVLEQRCRQAEHTPRPPSETSVAGYQVQIRQLTGAIRDRDATIERLRNAAPKPASDPTETRRKYIERQHELGAMALEAMDDMLAAGASHTPISRFLAESFVSSLPAGYRERWQFTKRPILERAASAQPRPT